MKSFLSFSVLFFSFLVCSAQFTPSTNHINTQLAGSQTAYVKVPLNYNANSSDSISLFVRKFPARKTSEGSIWLISGGPGESGASLYPLVDQFASIFPNLDIIIPDHRGTGLSAKICPNEENIDSPNGIGLANNEWGSCFNYMYTHQDYVKSFSITNAAKDLNYLIQKISSKGSKYVYAVSYGTQLALRMQQLGSPQLNGLILDSLVPLQNDEDNDLSHRSFVTNSVGNEVLNYYDSISQSEKRLTIKLTEILRREKEGQSFKNKLPQQKLSHLFGMMLNIPKVRNNIPSIINTLYEGDTSALNQAVRDIMSFHNTYASDYQTFISSIPLAQVISSSENNLRPKIKKTELALEDGNLLFTSPLPQLIAENSMPSHERDEYFAGTPHNLPPTLILHGTLDPKTSLNGADRHVLKLSKFSSNISYVKIKDAPHFIALFAPDGFAQAVKTFINGKEASDYMIDVEVELR